MKFSTKLWRRSSKSYATTIPQALLFLLDQKKRYEVEWHYDQKSSEWSINFLEADEKNKPKPATFNTLLWKRSQKSYATTIPQAVLIQIDESLEHEIIWEFNQKLKNWIIHVEEAKR